MSYCSYYGRLESKLLGDNIGIYCVDQAYKRILERHEERLNESQKQFAKDFKDAFRDEIAHFNRSVKEVSRKITELCKQVDEADSKLNKLSKGTRKNEYGLERSPR